MSLIPQLVGKQENHFLQWNGSLSSDWVLLSISGHESISAPYSFDAVSMTSLSDEEISKIHGQKVSCRIGDSSDKKFSRNIHGVVTLIQSDKQTGLDGNSICILRIEPSFALLRMGLSMRVWKNITVPDLVKELLSENKIYQLDIKLHNTYQKREYCIQYRESDFEFISRLMEEEGIYYYFVHESQQHRMVLADQPSSHPESRCSFIRWHNQRISLPEGCVYNWKSMSNIIPGEVIFLGYNIQQAKVMIGDSSSKDEFSKINNIAYRDMLPVSERTLLIEKAKARMEAFDTNTSFFTASTNAYWLSCGEYFNLTEHPEYNGIYRLQDISINATNSTGDDVGVFNSDIKLLRHNVNWRPVCTKYPPNISGVLTAKVVGPDGEDVHTDEFGRIKIQFQWDLKNAGEGKDSCWVRVSQPWSGNMFGMQFIPRVGSEVLVSFIQGNPDYPLVTGTVYNGQNKPPFPLPVEKFESGLVSRSIKGDIGEGHRLSFNDKKGEEKLIISAQKDYILRVRNDATTYVEHEFNKTIGGGRTTTINNGDDTLELKNGKYLLSVNNGGVCIDAGDKMEFKVGSNEITISSNGITIKGKTISIQGQDIVDIGGEISTVIKGKTINIG